MKQLSLAVIVSLITVSSARAEQDYKAWNKYFAGTWKITGAGPEGELKIEVVAKGTAGIGTGKDTDGKESAWIMGWDGAEKRVVHEWFGDDGEHGRATYEILNENSLRGPGVSRSSEGLMKGTVTIREVQ